MVAAEDGYLPAFLQKTNQHDAPTTLLLVQGVIVTLLSSLFLFMPTVNSSYWVLNVLTTQLYMLMYMCIFLAFMRLRYTHPDVERPFKVPGGMFGLWGIGLLGIGSMLFTLYIGFIPPKAVYHGVFSYDAILGSGLIIFCLPPLIMHVVRKNTFKSDTETVSS